MIARLALLASVLTVALPAADLPDFSFAGYRRGERAIPGPRASHNIRDFGAKGDGVTDDTAAFLRAVAGVDDGVIVIPRGRYVVTQIVEITKPNLVFRGEDRDGTVLYFPRPLQEIRPDWSETTSGQKTSNYSWAGGMIWVRGNFGRQILAKVVAPADRGGKTVRVDSAARLKVGDEIELYQHDIPANTLAASLYGGDPGDVSQLKGSTFARLTARIVQIEGDMVTLDRALRSEVRPEWSPELRAFTPTVTEVGLENLTFEFPVTPYAGHFTEQGFNPFAFTSVAHCWARSIRVVNADSGPFIGGRFCTVEDIVFESSRPIDPKTKANGHHGVYIEDDDNLYTRFDYRMRFVHDLSVSHCAGNVFSAGKGVDLCFDHHKRAPYGNLFTDIDAGQGSRLWACGGGAGLGKNCGAWGTFWNIRARQPLSAPPALFGPAAMHLAVESREPGDLHAAQLAHRLLREAR